MACRSQQLFLLAGIFGLVLLGKPAKTSASTVEILTSNVEDLAAVSSGGDRAFLPDTNLNSREGLRAAYEFPQLPAESELAALEPTLPLSAPAEIPDLWQEAANSATGTLSTKTQETELFNPGQKLEENIDRKKTDLGIDPDSHLAQLPNPILPREPELPAPTAPQPPPSSPLQPTPLTP
ncbi:MAG: ShlB/FhaC/HecB family hemolysin secretion/activation protein, partial [Microcoleus sp. T1-bin1]|nr:ShlB/FhaC/HecB family hemolysin secretion/activation protein [Microcoleus sp. T1-bin1]